MLNAKKAKNYVLILGTLLFLNLSVQSPDSCANSKFFGTWDTIFFMLLNHVISFALFYKKTKALSKYKEKHICTSCHFALLKHV